MDKRGALDFVLLPGEPKATSFLIKVIQKKGHDLWMPGKSSETREKVYRAIYLSTKKKYCDVTEEKIKKIWANLLYAYVRPDVDCRYRTKLAFLEGVYPTVGNCEVVIEPVHDVDNIVRRQFNIFPSTSGSVAKMPLMNQKPSNDVSRSGEASTQTCPDLVHASTSTQTSAESPVDSTKTKLQQISVFCNFMDRRLRGLIPDEEQQRVGKFIIKNIKEKSKMYL